jgi:hypothetical protein
MNPLINRLCLGLAAALLLAGCKTTLGTLGIDTRPAAKDPGADKARSELAALQADPDLASRAPAAIKEAQDAVNAAEVPQSNPVLASHLAYMAQRKVATARALAESRQAEDHLNSLRAQRAQPLVSTAPNGTPEVQLPPGQTVPLNPGVPAVPTGPGTTGEVSAPPAPAPTVTVPPMTPPVTSGANAPVVPVPQTAPAPQAN